MELSNGIYSLQRIPVTELCQRFGTPLYVYDSAVIERQVRQLKQAFAASNLRIKYAAKALTNLSVIKLMRTLGVGVDVVSIQEVHLALRAGYTGSEIMFTPSCAHFAEIEEAVSLGLTINIDSLPYLRQFGERYGNTYPCGIRLNPHIMAGGNLKISTGHKASKFGISIEQLDELIAIVNQYNIRIAGLHIHTGSEITETDVFLKMADVLFGVARHFRDLSFIDFGSGFKVAYQDGDKVTNIADVGEQLSKRFNQFTVEYGRPLELWIEPGKYLVSEAGYLFVEATVVKQNPDITFVGVNSGLNHLIRPMMYDAYHKIINISNPSGPEQRYTVVGYICETDTLGADRMLPEVKAGDILGILNGGAYAYTMASNYNSRLRPAEVLIHHGQAHLIRERETLDDLLRGQRNVTL